MFIDTNDSNFEYFGGAVDSNRAKYLVGTPAQIQALGFPMGL